MNDLERRRYNMFVRVRDFGAENASDFPSGTIGNDNFTIINTTLNELDEHSAVQTSGLTKHSTTGKAAARSELRAALRSINITAQSIAVDNPGIIEMFRMPRGDNNQQLLATARSFMKDAEPLKNQFVAYGLADAFLNNLETDIQDFEQAITNQGISKDHRVGATASIDSGVEKGLNAVKRLKAAVINKYADNPAKLAAWTSASHIEKPTKKKKTVPPTA
jgi:hypothetical protein